MRPAILARSFADAAPVCRSFASGIRAMSAYRRGKVGQILLELEQDRTIVRAPSRGRSWEHAQVSQSRVADDVAAMTDVKTHHRLVLPHGECPLAKIE